MYKNTMISALKELLQLTPGVPIPLSLLENPELSRYFIRFEAGDTIIYQKDPVNYFYILLSGQTIIMNQIAWSTNDIINFVQPPHILGLSEYLNHDSLYNAFVVAGTRCLTFKIGADDFIRLIQSNTELCYDTLSVMGSMFTLNTGHAETRRIFHPKDYVGYYLYIHARDFLPSRPYVYPLTRTAMSAELSINLRTLYRYLDTLKEEGYLTLKKGKIIIEKEHFLKLSERYGKILL